MNKILKIYTPNSGRAPFSGWLSKIKDKTTRARIRHRLDLLELGHYGDYKSVGDRVFELRLQFGPGYRIYFSEVDNTIILLLCGGDKSNQSRDIEAAKRIWKKMENNINE